MSRPNKQRDLSHKEFMAALGRLGMRPEMMGYVDVGVPGHSLCVCRFNAGGRRRDQLAYLLAERDRYCKREGIQLDA